MCPDPPGRALRPMPWLNSNTRWHTAAITCPTSAGPCAGQSCTARAHPAGTQAGQVEGGFKQAGAGRDAGAPTTPHLGTTVMGDVAAPGSHLFCMGRVASSHISFAVPSNLPAMAQLFAGAWSRHTTNVHLPHRLAPAPRATTAPILPHLVSMTSLNAITYLKANHQMALTPWQVSCPGTRMCSEADFQFITLQHPSERKRACPSLRVGQEEATFNGFPPSFHTVLCWSAKQPRCLFFKSCLLPDLGSST